MNQADYKKVRDHMLDRLWNVFGEPKSVHDFEAFINEYVTALGRYEARDLQEGTDLIFRSLRVKSWPTIKECIDATRSAANERWKAERKAAEGAGKALPKDDVASARQAEIDAMVRPLAKQAIEQGWILGLHDFVRDRRRVPTTAEQRKLLDDANFVSACADPEVDLGNFHDVLKPLAQSMVAKRERLAIKYGEMAR